MRRLFWIATAAVLFFSLPALAKDYKLYIGDLHTHTSYSDGKGFPAEAYDRARNVGHFDFLAVTDHVEQLGYREDLPKDAPKENEYDATKKLAKEKNEDGKFVALAGFEWATDPTQGHVNILYADEITNFSNGYPLKRMYIWLSKHPDALMGFNHPNEESDKKLVFNHMQYVPQIASQTIYVATNVQLDFPFYFMALDNGWWVAPSAQEDNHSATWGTHPSGACTGVYAEELTYAAIRESLRSRRFYAMNDRDIALRFDGNGQPMGSRLAADKVDFNIDINYKSEKKINTVKLISNKGSIVKEWAPAASTFKGSYSVSAPADGTSWYVVLAEAPNDKFAISAPIIIKKQ